MAQQVVLMKAKIIVPYTDLILPNEAETKKCYTNFKFRLFFFG